MDLMSLIATLTLDSSQYTEGLAAAKKAAEEASETIQKALDGAEDGGGKRGRPKGSKNKPKEKETVDAAKEAAGLNLNGVKTFIEYVVDNSDKLDTTTGKLETFAVAFGKAAQESSNATVSGIGKFVEYLGTHSEDLGTTSGKLETFANAFLSATEGSDNTKVKAAHTFVEYMVDHKEDLGTTSGKITAFVGALGETLQLSDDPLQKGAGKFLSYIASHKDDFNSVAGVITTLAGGLGEALKGSDNEGIALAGDFMSYMAQNASALTSPVGVIMTLLVYLVNNWDTISAFFDSVAPEWLKSLPGDLAEFWQNLIDKISAFVGWINTAIERIRAFFSVDDNTPEFSEEGQYDDSGRLTSPGGLPDDNPWSTPTFASGLDYVPRNGYRAVLHEGEAILNKSDASAWRRGDGIQIDYERMAQAFAGVLSGMNVSMDGQTVGRITAETVSREIERQTRAGRFAYA